MLNDSAKKILTYLTYPPVLQVFEDLGASAAMSRSELGVQSHDAKFLSSLLAYLAATTGLDHKSLNNGLDRIDRTHTFGWLGYDWAMTFGCHLGLGSLAQSSKSWSEYYNAIGVVRPLWKHQ